MTPQPLWTPSASRIRDARITSFMRRVEKITGRAVPDYDSLHTWSIEEPTAFWSLLWDECGVVGHKGECPALDLGKMPGTRWFPDAKLNFAQNLLHTPDDSTAIVFRAETGATRTITRRALYDDVSRLAQALRATGVAPGDRVAAYIPNIPEAVIAMLATASLGAVWSSCSPDFGVRGILDRFGQIEPKVLLFADGYSYNGKQFQCTATAESVAQSLPSLEQVIMIPQADTGATLPGNRRPRWSLYSEFTVPYAPAEIEFAPLDFDHPLYILYSSGTTGAPKCIVHGTGGTLLQHLKEHQLHTDIGPGDRVFYFTTTGWMMWNWLVSALASRAAVMLFDGSPMHPNASVLFEFADEERITAFGASAKYIDALRKAGVSPIDTRDLGALKVMLSTGSPLAPESFDYVYRHIKQDLCLSSISGGTDIVSCFALGCPIRPVWRGELQCRGLGMKVEVYDEAGRSVADKKGELVCTAPFPSMPVGFWNDPQNEKYRAAYFDRYPGVWHHGDYVQRTAHDGLIIYGRSDAVLNPGGVRIGTAELYRVVEQIDDVLESLAVGQEWRGDVRIILFVRLRGERRLDDLLTERIKKQIRAQLSPRHVPAKIVQVSDIPRTKSGKIVELAVRDVLHGRPVKNIEALANPEALEQFKDPAVLHEPD
jgi:acetoacetyl-CoA synthetase